MLISPAAVEQQHLSYEQANSVSVAVSLSMEVRVVLHIICISDSWGRSLEKDWLWKWG